MQIKKLIGCLAAGIQLILLAGCSNSINSYERVKNNYAKEIDRLAPQFDLPSPYLKALIILESSGKKDITPRFEPNVYNKLLALRSGKKKTMEGLRTKDIQDASDEALRNLASSWGPFQLMGYKCLELGIQLKDMRGKEVLYWSLYWINKNYGDYLRQKRFAEAFRIHNTGSPTGGTHDPNYVKKGLKHMDYFEKN